MKKLNKKAKQVDFSEGQRAETGRLVVISFPFQVVNPNQYIVVLTRC